MKSTGRTNIAPGRGGIERDPETLSNHRFWDGSQQEMLKRCLSLDVTLTRKKNLHVQVSISAKGVGHRVPSGFIDRHLILVVEAFAGEKELSMIRGAKLPAAVGQTLSGKAGHLFAKILRDSKGRFPVPFWRAGGTMTDTRLKPESTQHFEFAFPKQATQIRARLIYRRFWQEVIDAKGWKDQEILVKDWSRRLE